MPPNSIPPVVRIQLEGAAQHAITAIIGHMAEVNSITEELFKEELTPEKIRDVLQVQVRAAVKQALESSVVDFFAYGPGRSALRDAVYKELSARLRAGDFPLPGDPV